MPSLSGIRERRHAAVWDTLVHPPLPCDAWIIGELVAHRSSPLSPLGVITRSDFASRYLPPEQDTLIWIKIAHEYPTIRALEVKHADDIVGWDLVTTDGWLRMID